MCISEDITAETGRRRSNIILADLYDLAPLRLRKKNIMKTTTIIQNDNNLIRQRIHHLINLIHARNAKDNNKGKPITYFQPQLNFKSDKRKVA